MVLGWTQPLTEMSTRSISWGKGGRCIRLTTYHHPVLLSRNLGTLTSWNPLGLSRPVMGLFFFKYKTRYYNSSHYGPHRSLMLFSVQFDSHSIGTCLEAYKSQMCRCATDWYIASHKFFVHLSFFQKFCAFQLAFATN